METQHKSQILAQTAGGLELHEENRHSNIDNDHNRRKSLTDVQRPQKLSLILLSAIWASMMLLAIAMSLAGQTVLSYQPYALSEFDAHSMLSVIGTIQYILYAIVKPALARAAVTWGLFEAFGSSILAISIGFAINAASQHLGDIAAGQIFYTIGQVGIQFLQQILIADLTTLENRSILGSLVLSPPIFTAWIGAPIVSAIIPGKWRWGYGMWAIIFPVVSFPLLCSLWRYRRHSPKAGGDGKQRSIETMFALFSHLDIPGLLLLTGSLTLILLPMTLTVSIFYSWSSPAKLSMIAVGGCLLIGFAIYELYVSSHPIILFRLAKNRTIAAGCIIQFVLYLSFYIWQPYFYSFLVVVNKQSAKASTNIVASQGVATAVVGLLSAFVVKLTGTYKWATMIGMVLKLVGAGLMLRYSISDAAVVQILFGQLISGAGTGMISIICQTAVQAISQHQDTAAVTTLYEASGAVGGAIGNAVSGIVWTSLLLPRLRTYLPAAERSAAIEIENSFVLASSYSPGSSERIAIDKSYTEAMHVLLIMALVVLPVPFFAMFAIEEVNLKDVQKKDESMT